MKDDMQRRSRLGGWLLAIALAVAGIALLRDRTAERDGLDPPPSAAADRGGPASAEEKIRPEVAALSGAEPEREAVLGSRASGERPGTSAAFITGIVTERSGAPIASASCELRPGLPASSFAVELRDDPSNHPGTLSDADGVFRLAAGPGFWRLTVRSPGFAARDCDHLVAGDHLEVRLDPEVLLLVSVLDLDGAPVADADVIIRPMDDDSEPERSRARTDPAGRAAVTGLAPGAWVLIVRRHGFGVRDEVLEIPPGQFVIEKEVWLDHGTSLAGTVRSSAGAPIAGARVRIESPYRHSDVVEEALSGADGRYRTAPVFAVRETLEVIASAEGFAEAWLFFAVRPEQAGAEEVTLDFALDGSARTVVGRIVEAGQGVSGASIRIASIEPVGTLPEDILASLRSVPSRPWLWQEAVRADESGRFEIAGLAATPQYILLVVRDGFAPRVVWVPPGEVGTRTELGELELDRHGSLFGRAVFEDGAPAEGIELALFIVPRVMVKSEAELGAWRPSSWSGPQMTRTGENGRFRFDLLAPGSYQFTASAEDWEVEPERATGPVEVVVKREQPESENVVVSGVVHDRAGQPLRFVFVRAFGAQGAPEGSFVSAQLVNARGEFTVRLPMTSSSRLHFTDLGGTHLEYEILLAPPLPAEPLAVVLEERTEPAPALEGTVFSPRGDALEGCDVTLRPPEDSLCRCIEFHARTDPSGEFRFRVGEGPHRLTAAHPRYATATLYPARPGEHIVIDLKDR